MVKRRRGKRRNPSYRRWVTLLLLVVCAAVVFAVYKTRTHRQTARRVATHGKAREKPQVTPSFLNKAEAERHLRLALEKAGGDGVWIKPPEGPSAFTAIISTRAYPAASQALRDSARELGLRIEGISDQPAPGRIQWVAAYSGSGRVFDCTLREVPRIVRVSIIVDDLGQNLERARALIRLDSPLTFSVMPAVRYSRQTADEAHAGGIEVMLHLPMQPMVDSAPDISKGELRVGMPSGEVDGIIQSALESVPYAAGVNNHMGSRATADPRLMAEVMADLARRRLYYVDSRTIPTSVAFAEAKRAGVPAFYRSVFLDDQQSVRYTLGQLRELCHVADRTGAALAIGHPYPSTITALRQFIPVMAEENIQLVRVSELLRQPETAFLSPTSPRLKRPSGTKRISFRSGSPQVFFDTSPRL
ncbi:MAG: divergent polysaccharide deacetylase family protein [Acidobacteriota bacterium]|nr:divergent polysaccharide deacetylase family protein [Acidobacteriota bacterium]